MSWSFSLVLAEEFSARGFWDTEQCARSSSIRTAGKSSFAGKRRATWIPFPYGTTSEHSMAERGVERWISCLRGSRASRSRSPGSNRGNGTTVTCGPTPYESFAKWDQDSRSWRTCQTFWPMTISARSSETWQRRGSMRDGKLYRLPSSEPRTGGNGSGLLPTHQPLDPFRVQLSTNYRRQTGAHRADPPRGGWPIGWTDLEPLGTDRFHEWFKMHGID